jgi:hypothetical protein
LRFKSDPEEGEYLFESTGQKGSALQGRNLPPNSEERGGMKKRSREPSSKFAGDAPDMGFARK